MNQKHHPTKEYSNITDKILRNNTPHALNASCVQPNDRPPPLYTTKHPLISLKEPLNGQ
ncbi:MAG: hypothetical protein JEZ14_20890 [Marinilabiliaceae bacterium]|nr:hypothetical protein [Marinilabiliaceae bacterium]